MQEARDFVWVISSDLMQQILEIYITHCYLAFPIFEMANFMLISKYINSFVDHFHLFSTKAIEINVIHKEILFKVKEKKYGTRIKSLCHQVIWLIAARKLLCRPSHTGISEIFCV